MNGPLTICADVLMADVGEAQPAGVFDEENDDFQAIDHEMVKLGGLREESLDWAYVEEASCHYLQTQCKHLRVVGHLISSQLRLRDWKAWAGASDVLAGFVDRYWEKGYPKPGALGYLHKRKMVSALLVRLQAALTTLDPSTYDGVHRATGHAAVDSLHKTAPMSGLDVAQLTQLEAHLVRHAEAASRPSAETSPALTPFDRTTKSVSTMPLSAPLDLALSTERDSRRTMLMVAEHIESQDGYDPASYSLRRFALWWSIRAAPSIKRDRRTDLMGVPGDVAKGYHDNVTSHAVSTDLLRRIEKSVVSSPFWLRGSWLAANAAMCLEMQDVSTAIREATRRFVRRIPTLTELEFSDGTPFIDQETWAWISGNDEVAPCASPDLEILRSDLVELLATEGIEAVLMRLQHEQALCATPRRRCQTIVLAADALAAKGLSWLAEDLYANVRLSMETTSADQWEPDLHDHLMQRSANRPSAKTATHKGVS